MLLAWPTRIPMGSIDVDRPYSGCRSGPSPVGYSQLDFARGQLCRGIGFVSDAINQSINQFQTGDFDMVLLCHSIPLQERDRLACAIRSSGYRVPVVLVASVSQECSRGCADAILENHPKALVQGIERA